MLRETFESILKIAEAHPEHKEIIESFLSNALHAAKIFAKKQLDYGPNNIAEFGEAGVLVRMNDKMARLKNLILNNQTPRNEAIEDTLIDIANYALIFLMLRQKKWPGAKEVIIRLKEG